MKWDAVCICERNWLRYNGSSSEKRRLRDLYVSERRNFERLNKKAKRKYQLGEQLCLLDLQTGHNTRHFWRESGKLGIQNERKMGIPMEV